MPRPSRSDVHVNRPLGNVMVNYTQKAENFAAADAFPIVPVENKSDFYFVINKDDWFRDEAQERAPGKPSAGGGYDVDNTPSYSCRRYSYHKDVDEETRLNTDKPLDPDKNATQFVTEKLLIKRERAWGANCFGSGIWGNSLTGVTGSPSTNEFKKWNSTSGVTIIQNVEDWKELIAGVTGYEPNVMVVAPDVLRVLKNASEITDRVKYTQKGIITEDLLAELFGVKKFVVPRAVVNTAKKGATASVGRIIKGKVLLLYATDKPSIDEPSAGYIFAWKGFTGASKLGSRIKKFRMEELDSDRIEGDMAFDIKVVAPDLGVHAASVV